MPKVSGRDDIYMRKISCDTLNLPFDEFMFSRLSSVKKFVKVATPFPLSSTVDIRFDKYVSFALGSSVLLVRGF